MIGIITAVAVITSEILLLANTQEIYVGSSSFDDGTTYCLDSKSTHKVLVMFLVV